MLGLEDDRNRSERTSLFLGATMLSRISNLAALLVAVAIALVPTTLWAQKYTPEHPVVQQMVNRGVEYLSKSPLRGGGEEGADGIAILAGYAVYKVTYEPNHPVVVHGVETARRLARMVASPSQEHNESKILYIISLAGMLLPTVDVDKYGAETKMIRDFLVRCQKNHGGFGYMVGGPYFTTGDISQTQYVMLSLWTMSQLGIDIPEETMARTSNFLVAAQEANGGWPYQAGGGTSSGGSTHSLSAAGLSALLIAGDALGLYRSKIAQGDEEEGVVPEAFRRVVNDPKKKRPNIDRGGVDLAATKGENWHRNNTYIRTTWHYYFLYSRERYESFLEITKRKQTKSPDWYNAGVEELRENQVEDGSWGKEPNADRILSPDVSTCFAILFLIRSTQKAIGEINEGFLEGGWELPKDLSAVKASGGKVISKTETTSIDDALKMLEDEGKSEGEDKLVAEKMKLSTDPKTRKEQLNRFARLLSSKDYKARQVAAKLLGRGDDIDLVPALIYALTDPDPLVPRIAEQSLRLVSRQIDTYIIPKEGNVSDSDRAKAAQYWKRWYLTLRPNFVFVD